MTLKYVARKKPQNSRMEKSKHLQNFYTKNVREKVGVAITYVFIHKGTELMLHSNHLMNSVLPITK